MESLNLAAQVRSEKGKEAVKKLRARGLLPAVVYGGKDQPPLSVTVDDHDFRQLLKQHEGQNVLINLQVGGLKERQERPVLLKEVQAHPYKDQLYHLDFLQVALDKKVKVTVSLYFEGKIPDNTVLEHHLREIEVECLPGNIPETITVDVSGLEVGQSVIISDLPVPFGVTLLDEPDRSVVSVLSEIASEAVGEEEEEEGTAGAEPSQE